MLREPTVGAVVFFVRDLARTVAWYRDALGLEPRTLEGHDGPFALATAGAIELVFIKRDEPAGRTPIARFSSNPMRARTSFEPGSSLNTGASTAFRRSANPSVTTISNAIDCCPAAE